MAITSSLLIVPGWTLDKLLRLMNDFFVSNLRQKTLFAFEPPT